MDQTDVATCVSILPDLRLTPVLVLGPNAKLLHFVL